MSYEKYLRIKISFEGPCPVFLNGSIRGVRYVLEGSVRRAEDNVRITAQLVDAISGKHLWAERYDRKLENIFSVQDEITKKIITELRVKLTEGEHAQKVRITLKLMSSTFRLMRYFTNSLSRIIFLVNV